MVEQATQERGGDDRIAEDLAPFGEIRDLTWRTIAHSGR